MLAGGNEWTGCKFRAEVFDDGRGDKLGMGVEFTRLDQLGRGDVVFNRGDLDPGKLWRRPEEIRVRREHHLAGIETETGHLERARDDRAVLRGVPVLHETGVGDLQHLLAGRHHEPRAGTIKRHCGCGPETQTQSAAARQPFRLHLVRKFHLFLPEGQPRRAVARRLIAPMPTEKPCLRNVYLSYLILGRPSGSDQEQILIVCSAWLPALSSNIAKAPTGLRS
jgi:hypothetical protein